MDPQKNMEPKWTSILWVSILAPCLRETGAKMGANMVEPKCGPNGVKMGPK